MRQSWPRPSTALTSISSRGDRQSRRSPSSDLRRLSSLPLIDCPTRSYNSEALPNSFSLSCCSLHLRLFNPSLLTVSCRILLAADPNSFASLVLLNSKWRHVSQQAYLYAHHLSECPSYAASHAAISDGNVKQEDLPKLRRPAEGDIQCPVSNRTGTPITVLGAGRGHCAGRVGLGLCATTRNTALGQIQPSEFSASGSPRHSESPERGISS